jgi:hypothetical protein
LQPIYNVGSLRSKNIGDAGFKYCGVVWRFCLSEGIARFLKNSGQMPAEILLITRSMKMKELIIMLGVAGVWILLQAYILPKLGIST